MSEADEHAPGGAYEMPEDQSRDDPSELAVRDASPADPFPCWLCGGDGCGLCRPLRTDHLTK